MLATAFFDGTVGIHSLQSTNDVTVSRIDGVDIFDVSGFERPAQPNNTLSLKQPPKWLRRPVSSSFGFGGQLITVSNLPSAQGKTQSSAIHLRKIVTEAELVGRAKKLVEAVQGDNLQGLAEAAAAGAESWKALLSLFKANSREELITLLGFSKDEVAARVSEAVENLKVHKTASEEDESAAKPHESVVSFIDPPSDPSDIDEDSAALELTPSEVSGGVTSDTASARHADGESATTAPSLFGDEVPGAPQHDFFGTVGESLDVPHASYGLDSSVAATIGSGPSSVTSDSSKNTGFKIYPPEDSDLDKLVTKAIVLGDFESAVALCLSSNRFADAILLAVRGSPDLLQRTQKAYFDCRAAQIPSLRLFQSIVTNDLGDVVQNADLQEWRDIFVVLCTFALEEDFPALAEQLGSRLEYRFKVSSEDDETGLAYRKNTILTLLTWRNW
jgi:protein transport protein SEC31